MAALPTQATMHALFDVLVSACSAQVCKAANSTEVIMAYQQIEAMLEATKRSYTWLQGHINLLNCGLPIATPGLTVVSGSRSAPFQLATA